MSSAVRARFLAQLAHDLRSPLNVIGSTLTELQQEPSALRPDERAGMLALASRSVARLVGLSDRLTTASRLELGLAAALQPTELVGLTRRTLEKFVAGEKRARIELLTAWPPGPLNVPADSQLLAAAMLELFANANRHARRQMRVEVFSGAQAFVAVEDDGEGISRDEEPTLFEAFVERHSRSGLGIGLWLAQSVMKLQQGAVVLEQSRFAAEPTGKTGARLVLQLPLAP